MATAAILIVGDEILDGHTQDTNSHYFANRLRACGLLLRRIVTVPDDVDEIERALLRLAGDAFDHVFVCGGIGPTPDDRTYEAVAMAAGAPLVVTKDDEAWMKARITAKGYGQGLLDDADRAEALWRMVRRPEGSRRIDNPVGAALGSIVTIGASKAYVLPGVPRELRAMMEQVVEPILGNARPTGVVAELEVVAEEARLWPALLDAESRFPGVRLGSYPQDDRGRIILRVQGAGDDVEAAVRRLQASLGIPTTRIR
ncbi:MAG TPA: competence/damage-inducible protein A [Candidatus Thermoplasmatota archaeon]|nr:competence/damage-inducible protein A [Candidatus Thermoplasmatota archaeon]